MLLTSSTIPFPDTPRCSCINGVVDSLSTVVLAAIKLPKAVAGTVVFVDKTSRVRDTSDSGSSVNNSYKVIQMYIILYKMIIQIFKYT